MTNIQVINNWISGNDAHNSSGGSSSSSLRSVNGVLYKNSIVKISEHNQKNNTIRVIDSLGKIWWVEPSQVSSSFL